ncbi:Serine protease inhibitor dipetalogastin [Orchesella cincta]|uniref:Serine protease inhibitor dipetalogastin n=1 Tax=Orchesella cincta TaxID=48709 RepID=A0A1D2MIZ2_ORCCI|nr:Serine protease inhibitor dipetalogastin [Orchesella cincta]
MKAFILIFVVYLLLSTNIVLTTSQQSPPPCICTTEWSPVCGSNGQTYGNICRLNCDRDRYPGLAVVSTGPCNIWQWFSNLFG